MLVARLRYLLALVICLLTSCTAQSQPPSSLLPTEKVSCPAATITVKTGEALAAALTDAQPGDTIWLEDGTYIEEDNFVATVSGTAENPIFLCGGSGAVLEDNGPRGDYVFHLDGGDYWRLVGFTARNGQKGVVADGSQHSVFQELIIEDIGDEALHLRSHSSDNLVVGNTIRRTGLRRDKFGEGIYVGSAVSNWCSYTDCEPDRSHRNVIVGNTISETTAENIDIKEGTSSGVIRGNTFDGSALVGADSWVDVKGNDWLIEGNRGQDSPEDGFQTHQILEGWGTNNIFRDNDAAVNGSGYGFHFAPVLNNTLTCDNRAEAAGLGLSNVPCK